MVHKSYYQRLGAFCAGLLVLCVVLSVVLYSAGPRVRYVQFSEAAESSRLSKNSTMTIVFDRPLEQNDYTDLISFKPELSFESQTGAQSITLTILQSMKHSTDYEIRVAPGVVDKTGKVMSSDYNSTFETVAAEFVYIQRSYGTSPDAVHSSIDALDHVYMSTVSGTPESLFAHPEIRSIAANSTHVAVIAKEELFDVLYTINRDTLDVRQEELPDVNGRIKNVTMSERGGTMLFTVEPDFRSVSEDYYQEYANRLVALELSTGSASLLSFESGDPIRAFSIAMHSNGQYGVIESGDLAYYGISPFGDFDPIFIGTFSSSFGLANNQREILFRDRESYLRYDVSTSESEPVDLSTIGLLQQIYAENEVIFASSTIPLTQGGRSAIERHDSWDSVGELVWSSEDSQTAFIRGFSASYDDSLLAVHVDPDSCRYDSIGVNSQCTTAATLLVDVETKETVAEISGFDIVWLP